MQCQLCRATRRSCRSCQLYNQMTRRRQVDCSTTHLLREVLAGVRSERFGKCMSLIATISAPRFPLQHASPPIARILKQGMQGMRCRCRPNPAARASLRASRPAVRVYCNSGKPTKYHQETPESDVVFTWILPLTAGVAIALLSNGWLQVSEAVQTLDKLSTTLTVSRGDTTRQLNEVRRHSRR